MDENTQDNKKKHWQRTLGLIFLLLSLLLIGGAVYVLVTARRLTERVTEEPWYESYVPTEPQMPEVVSFTENYTAGSSISSRFSYGNSRALRAMDAPLAEDTDYYYAPDFTDSQCLVRISKKDPKEKQILCELIPECMNLSGSLLYFLGSDPLKPSRRGIYRIATDGSGLTLLRDGHFYKLRKLGDWLYYISAGDGSICKMHVQERHAYQLVDVDCNDLCVEENTIYYISHDKSLSQNAASRIESVDVDGDHHEILSDYGNYSSLFFADGLLYYSISNEGYGWIDMRVQPAPQDAEEDEEDEAEDQRPQGFVRLQGFSSVPVVVDGEAWFIDRREMRSLAAYQIESGQLRHYGIENVTAFYRMKDVLIVRWLKDGTEPRISVNRLDTGEMMELF